MNVLHRAEEINVSRAIRPYDPLSCIPRTTTIRERLAIAEQIVRRLRILLRTAERIERTGNESTESSRCVAEVKNVG